jgi:tRNA(fMet)-specific endonuclease VapC
VKLTQHYQTYIPAIVRYEVLRGDKDKDGFWLTYFANKGILPFDNACAGEAVFIYRILKQQNSLIGPEDLLIAATALANKLPLATLNKKHFERVDNLILITPETLTA